MDQSGEENFDDFPVADALDTAILMHRDVHFGGQFGIMLDYYEHEGKGIVADFDIERIRALQELELQMKQNLAGLLLSGPEAERVAQAKDAYKRLRELYEKRRDLKNKHSILIADLILSEDEHPENEINAIIAEGAAIVPGLMELLKSEDFHDPLFPGYGLVPDLAVECLGAIGDKRAIIALFESIGESDVFSENLALEALRKIGEPAKAFLLKVLHGRPLNFDNERAADALILFQDDPEVVQACFKMLKELNLKKDTLLAAPLILTCEGLTDPTQRKEFIAMGENPQTPNMLRQDMMTIAEHWTPKKDEKDSGKHKH